MNKLERWWIALAGILLQMALGAVYAWSVFRVPLAKQFNWSISEVTLTFTIAIMVLGFASFFGGLWLKRVGPRAVALTGGALYGLGVFLASFSYHGLWWLYLSYGVIGGIVRAKRIGAYEFSESVGAVRFGHPVGAHLVQHHRDSRLGNLPGRFRTGEAGADNMH